MPTLLQDYTTSSTLVSRLYRFAARVIGDSGDIKRRDVQAVFKFIDNNRGTLLRYWYWMKGVETYSEEIRANKISGE